MSSLQHGESRALIQAVFFSVCKALGLRGETADRYAPARMTKLEFAWELIVMANAIRVADDLLAERLK